VNARDAWDIAFSQLELQLDRASFDTWLRDAAFLAFEDDVFTIGVRNSFARDMLQHRLYRNICQVLSDVYGAPIELRFEVQKVETASKATSADMPLFRLLAQQDSDTLSIPLHEQVVRPTRAELPETELNPRFTFERFIVNQSCRLTYEAAQAVTEHPGSAYNPLLVYGGVGLGKTHLLQAITHCLQARGLRVIYISSEAFTNDLVDAIRQRTTAMFRDKYRSVDALLVDDIQFITGKDTTQEEFFYTFNALHNFNKQIVLASDRHPSQLTLLEDRLRSRFEGGLVADVQPPEFETRLAIMQMWAGERGVSLPYQVYEMIAERAQANVRELEGIFNQIAAKAKHGTQTLMLDSAETTLRHYERPREVLTLAQVLAATAHEYGFTLDDLTGTRRTQRINQARQVAMFLAREITDASLSQIGEIFGRSHTTILHGCNRVAEDMERDDVLRRRVEKIRSTLVKS
jgi:chromosomal replication initiator protein